MNKRKNSLIKIKLLLVDKEKLENVRNNIKIFFDKVKISAKVEVIGVKMTFTKKIKKM